MGKLSRFPSNEQVSAEGRFLEHAVGHKSGSQISRLTTIVFVFDNDVVRESLELLVGPADWQPKTELQKRVPVERTGLPIIFIPGYGDVPKTVRAMKRGAVESLTKPFNGEVFLTAIRQAFHRSRLALIHETETEELRNRYASLTPRERQVIALVVSGLLNKQIGGELGISEVTVKAHRGQVMQKMKANSVADLVKMAVRLHLTNLS